MNFLKDSWNDIRRGENIDLYLTVLAAFGLGAFNVLGSAPQSWVSSVTLAALGVLAISALRNKHHTEEMIQRIEKTTGEPLRKRSHLVYAQGLAPTASDFSFVGVSGVSLFVNDLGFFEQKMKTGCKLRFVLLDPKCPALESWNLLNKVTTTEADIKNSLQYLKGIVQMEKVKGKCEVRLSRFHLPYALLMSDPNKDAGLMNVEFYTYRTTLNERPHVQLSRTHNRHWFDFYREQFEKVWADSETWVPETGERRT